MKWKFSANPYPSSQVSFLGSCQCYVSFVPILFSIFFCINKQIYIFFTLIFYCNIQITLCCLFCLWKTVYFRIFFLSVHNGLPHSLLWFPSILWLYFNIFNQFPNLKQLLTPVIAYWIHRANLCISVFLYESPRSITWAHIVHVF